MKSILCRLLGHQEYSQAVLAARPWDDPDFSEYERSAFRELRCVRCGELLPPARQAA